MADLTVIILTRNEEKNIVKCINSVLPVAKRIVLIDSFSNDRTLKLANELGAEIYQHEFTSHAEQFNWGIQNVSVNTKWIMKLDADEELTEELRQEINRKLDYLKNEITGVVLRRRVYFMGRWLRHGGKYPELLLRIFRTGHGLSELKYMDEHLVITDGMSVKFEHDFIDNNVKSLEWWTNKHNWYSNKEVQEYQHNELRTQEDKQKSNQLQSFQSKIKRRIKSYGYYRLPMFFRAHLYFIYRYYIRLGFLDGTEGRIYTFLQSYWYRFLVDAKIYECKKKKTVMSEQMYLND